MTEITYSYEQALTYEVARDLLNTYVADCSAELGIERSKRQPDQKRIEKLLSMQSDLLMEREQLDFTNDAAVRRVIAKYRRLPAGDTSR